jgi:S-DNA-T family DNA segregation ATPase FtsK/SpoIIIE
MPKIIIVIDELNDIMLQVRKPAEDLIMSIAQKARAAGIHLIIGTQRPSVDVITGVIKANIPSRISCKVASYNDSKTILEQAGAEKLLNNGDMLYIPAGAPKALRVQGAFVSDDEVSAVTKHIKSQVKGALYDERALEEINKAAQKCQKGKGGGDDAVDDDDDCEDGIGILNDQQFLDAVDVALRSRKIATSLLQRKLRIGYAKAASFIDYMQEFGIVSEPNGSKPREVLLSADEWHEKLARTTYD